MNDYILKYHLADSTNWCWVARKVFKKSRSWARSGYGHRHEVRLGGGGGGDGEFHPQNFDFGIRGISRGDAMVDG